jgi:hypothetical protein
VSYFCHLLCCFVLTFQVDLSKVQVPNFDLSKLPPPPSVEQLIAALNALQNGDIVGEQKVLLL